MGKENKVKSAASTDSRAAAQVYRDAAKAMEDGIDLTEGSCCWAIHVAMNRGDGDLNADPFGKRMRSVFAPRHQGAYWLRDVSNYADPNGHRIVALCFMAAMVESGDA